MLRLAYFSDIHGNDLALKEMLRDIDSIGADLAVCGGDLVGYGAHPNEVIQLLRERKLPVIMGNYDDGVGYGRPECGCAYQDSRLAELGRRSLLWSQREVTEENKAYLRGLPGRLELVSHGRKVLMVHGSPRRINEYLFADRPEESLARLFEAERADVILCGHTHLPYVRKVGESMLINAGSVGKPKDCDPRAGYVLVAIAEEGVKAEIRRVAYDVEAAAKMIEATELPREFAAAIREAQ